MELPQCRQAEHTRGSEDRMGKGLRSLLIVLGAVVIVAAAAWGIVHWALRSPLPQTRGTLRVPGLEAPVEVLRDPSGVPHIRAATMHDLYFAQGFVTAQERFWQMEFWRRIGSGRLSELFGRSTLGTDVYLRTVGFRRVAEEDWAATDAETKSVFQAYADGVNAYILKKKPGQLGLEFRLLGLQGVPLSIEPWVPQNSITWLKLMAQDLCGNMRRELYTIDLIQSLGLSLTRDFFGGYRTGEMPVIAADQELPSRLLGPKKIGRAPGRAQAGGFAPDPLQLAALAGVSKRVVGGFDISTPMALGTGPGIGSNNWVISGSRTQSGKPILANDPHLGIQMPSIWYEVDLYCSAQEAQMGKKAGGPFHVRGFSFAGVPAVVIGHNDRIAWGVTNLPADVQDLYVEKIDPENPRRYEVNGRWVDMKIRREEIKVLRQEEPVVVLVRETRHGPIITDEGAFSGYRGFSLNPGGSFPTNLELKALSLRWTALQPNNTIRAVVQLDDARDFKEFRDALRSWDIPSQNFVYADVDGNIGYQAPGLVPIRKKGDGTVPSPGWTDDYEWKGYVPFDDLPSVYNPAKGYISTANNPVTTGAYRWFIGDDFDLGFRARRIVEMIEGASGKISLSAVQAMQGDTLNISAREVLPCLAALPLTGDALRAREALQRWDMRMDRESSGAAVYAYFWQALVEEVFKDKLPDSLWNGDAVLDTNSRLMNTVAQLLKAPAHPMWDKPTTMDKAENRDDILVLAMQKAVKRGMKNLGPDIGKWRWGKVHTAVFRNQSLGRSGISLVERIFNRGPIPVGGGMQQVISSDWRADKPFGVSSISSMRQIVDLSDLSASVTMNATGQSGHVGSRHYDDMILPWSRVRYHSTLWDEKSLRSSRTERLVLTP
jgi:penicillin G amidase